jgi:hypothetical protein
MSDFNATITGSIPNEPTDEQKEAAAYDAGDHEAGTRLNTQVEAEHAAKVTEALQSALDSIAADIPEATALHCVGSVGTVIFDLTVTPPSPAALRREARAESRETAAAKA